MMEELQSQKVVNLGGLNSNVNHIQLSDNEPGSAVSLQNFESSLFGGYRRLSGYVPYSVGNEIVDAAGAEGQILLVSIYLNQIIVARKQKSGNTYEFYTSTGGAWAKIVTGLTRSSLGVLNIQYTEFNFKGTQKIAFVDGVNPMCIYDGTNWTEVKTANTGADFAHAGGNQAVNAPQQVAVFKNTLWMAQNNIVVYSAPLADYDWTVASGSGQLPAGYSVNNITPFRDSLYIFGTNNIKYVSVAQTASSTFFSLKDVTNNIGCIAPNSVQEINGDLIFLSQDGFRPVSGTDKIGDVELESVSRKIQQLAISRILANDMNQLYSVIVRSKSQVRFFFSSSAVAAQDTFGIVGCLRNSNPSQYGSTYISWEWGEIKGIRASCATSKYIGAVEYVIHGDYNGGVYRQEQGNDFNGMPVEAIYTTPFLDLGDACARKTLRKIWLFVRPEGNLNINTKLYYDWLDPVKIDPDTYSITASASGSVYDTAIYGTAVYGAPGTPVLIQAIEGSGFSIQANYSTVDRNAPYTIQGALYQFSVDGRK